jgi:hypothetical protein
MQYARVVLCCALVCLVVGVLTPWTSPDALEFEGTPPTSPDTSRSAGLWHLYDDFDIGTYYPSFDAVFGLYVTDGVDTEWDSTGVAQFIEAVMDDDSTNTADVLLV